MIEYNSLNIIAMPGRVRTSPGVSHRRVIPMASPQSTMPTATCTKCHIEKSIADFSPRHDRPGTRRTVCRSCRLIPRKSRRQAARRITEHDQARQKLKDAVKSGKIIRPSTCSDCGDPGRRIDAHHPDYARPYDVEWLCTRCHGVRHRKQRTGISPANKKLTDDDMRAICARAGTTSTAILAQEYRVSIRTIQRVIARPVWAHPEEAD